MDASSPPAPAANREIAAPSGGLTPGHFALALLVVAVWGTNFVVIHAALREFPPLLLAALRFGLAAFPAILVVARPRLSWRNIVGYGLSIGAGQFGLLFIAMNGMIAPGLASLVIQSQVFFTIALSLLLHGEPVSRAQIAALLLGAAGLAVIGAHGDAHTTPLGLALTLGAALSWAAGNLIVRASRGVPMFPFIIWASLAAFPPLALLSLVAEGPAAIAAALASASAAGWAAVAWQAFGNTIFGFGAWSWLLSRHAAATVTPMALLVPVFGMGAASLLIAEPMPAWKLFAAALVVGGLGLGMIRRGSAASR
jgi:O-acetylserine/cysteine efflux transporter